MSDRDFILAPEAITVKFQLAPARACLETLDLIADADEYDGLDEWIYKTRNAMSAEERHNNRMVLHGLFSYLMKQNIVDRTMPEMLDWLDDLDAIHLRDGCIAELLSHHDQKIIKLDQEPFPVPTAEHILENVDNFVGYFLRLYGDHVEESLLRDVYAMYSKPAYMKALMMHHLHEMWNNYLADEWQNVEPHLQACVDAFSKINFSGMSALEIARAVTGRDFSGNVLLNDEIKGATELRFVPSPHIGPYVMATRDDIRMDIVFRARMPEGTPSHSPHVDRSDLLVRLSALADDTRMQILNLLLDHEELCAPQVIKLLGLSQSAASRHLRQLTATGFLTERRREGAKCYSLNQRRIEEVIKALEDHLLS